MLEVKNIKKSFKNNLILDNITFKTDENEILGILGPNGAGKTTLIKIICNLIIPDFGEILLNNKSFSMDKINVVFDGNRQFYWPISSLENIYYFSALKGVFKKDIDSILHKEEIFNIVSPFLNTPYGELSLGQKQIVSVVIGLITFPEIICLDEPSNGLDIYYTEELVKILKTYKEKFNKNIIISSHDLNFLYKIADKFIIMNHGKILGSFYKNDLKAGELEKRYRDILEANNEKIF